MTLPFFFYSTPKENGTRNNPRAVFFCISRPVLDLVTFQISGKQLARPA